MAVGIPSAATSQTRVAASTRPPKKVNAVRLRPTRLSGVSVAGRIAVRPRSVAVAALRQAGEGGRIWRPRGRAWRPPFRFSGDGRAASKAVQRWVARLTRPRHRPAEQTGPSRILILMSDTGGGHRASAQAIKAGFQELYGDRYRVDVCDIWTDHTPWPCNRMPKSYSFLIKYPFLWRLSFLASQPRVVHVPAAAAVTAFVGRQLSKAFDEYRPNLVVSVHPLMQIVPLRVLHDRIRRGLQNPTKFATVVTDLSRCHNTWYYERVDRCFVATEESKKQALEMNLKEEQIRQYGLPIRPAFSKSYPPRAVLRKDLGMLQNVPSVLLASGGEGMGPVEKTVDAICDIVGNRCQLSVICGRNAKLRARLLARTYPDGMQVNVLGFVNNMPELMLASNVIITKAGPGTIMEALICGLPVVLNSFVPCQEEGNVPYVVDNKVGIFERKPSRIAHQLLRWFTEDGAALEAMAVRAKRLGQPDALFNIVRELASMVQ